MTMTSSTTSASRRALLATAAGTAGALALTGCGGDSDDSGGDSGDEAGSTSGSGGEDSGGSGDSEDSGDSGAAGAVASLDEVPVGEATAVTIDGEEAMLFRPDETTVAAFSAICTHNGCTIAPEDATGLRCPCHQSLFDAATGEVLQGPASEPLPPISVRIEGDQIVSG
jgi:Rieske Fe-S protein